MPKGKLLLTRPEAQSRAFAAGLPEIDTLISPLMAVVPVQDAAPLPAYDVLAFTSANAVDMFVAAHPNSQGLAFCVGGRTAAQARAHGFDAISADGDVRALLALIDSHDPHRNFRLLHPCGAQTTGDLCGNLNRIGFFAQKKVIYEAVSRPLNAAARAALARQEVAMVALFSPRSVQLFADALGDLPPPAMAAAISPSVSAEIRLKLGIQVIEAPAPNAAAMQGVILSSLLRT